MAANNESQLTKTGNKRTITTAYRSLILAVLLMLSLSILAPEFAALVDEQDEVDTEEQVAEDEANRGGDNEEGE